MQRRWWGALAMVTITVVASCAGGAPVARRRRHTESSVPVTSPRYQIDTTVLENADHGPELCASGVLESRPPICGGTPVVGWDWAVAPGAQAEGGVRWGVFHVVGTYDGTRFTLTEPPGPPRPPSSRGSLTRPRASFTTPCPQPPGGWAVTNPSRVTNADAAALQHAAEAAADYAGMWVDASISVRGPRSAPSSLVYDIGFTGDVDRHRAELQTLWGGPICVVKLPHTDAELRRVVNDLYGDVGRGLGLRVLGATPDAREGRVWASVLLADDAMQRAVDGRFGAGLVELSSALQPVP